MIASGDFVTELSPTSAADLATFDRQFAELRPRLMRICTGLVGADHAEDVIHDTYLRSRARIGQLRDAQRFDAWVARTAVNLCYNRHRSAGRLHVGRATPRRDLRRLPARGCRRRKTG